MTEKYVEGLTHDEMVGEFLGKHPEVSHTDALEVLHYFQNSYTETKRFMEHCYNPAEGHIVLQLGVHAQRVEEDGLCGCLEGEDLALAGASEAELSMIADEHSIMEEPYILIQNPHVAKPI